MGAATSGTCGASRRGRRIIPFILLAACNHALEAETATTTMSVGATVTSNCTITSSALNFGSIDTRSRDSFDASSAIAVGCTKGTAWSASVDRGMGAGQTGAERRMINGEGELAYSLFVDSERKLLWGDGIESGTSIINGVGSGSVQASAIYGRIPAGQVELPAGSYGDTVVVTLTY